MPLFSIIIPTRNRALLLEQCIASVIAQSCPDFELIIINDGSEDETKQVVGSFNDTRVKYFYQTHKERSTARNLGLENVSGEYICFIDDDDYILPHHLSSFKNTITDKNYNREILRVGYKYNSGNKIGPIYSKINNKNPVQFALKKMCGLWTLCIPTIYCKNIRFPEEFPHWQDTYYILRLLAKHPFRQLNEVSYVYRIHEHMGSLLVQNKEQLKTRAYINVAAILDFKKQHFHEISDKVNKEVFDFLAAEKFAMYAVMAKQNGFKKLSKELMGKSRSNYFSISLWKYYLRYYL